MTFGSGPLTTINGAADSGDFDVDVYCIKVTDPANFQAQVASYQLDPISLFLFNPGHKGVSQHSSACPSGAYFPSVHTPGGAGRYWLAVANAGIYPSSGGGFIWVPPPGMPAAVEYLPNGPGAGQALVSWSFNPPPTCLSGTYTIALTGTEFCERCIDPPAGMVGWWALDEPTGPTAKDSAGGNDGTYILAGPVGPTPTPSGKVDGALSFSGSGEHVRVPHHGSLDPGSGAFSIDLWAQHPVGLLDAGLVQKYTPGFGYSFVFEGGVPTLVMEDGSLGCVADAGVGTTSGSWQHYAVTVSAFNVGAGDREVNFYVNGVVTANSPLTVQCDNLSNTAPLLIGHTTGPFFVAPFEGELDEVEIFKSVLDAAKILDIYQADSAGKCKCVPPVPNRVYTLDADFDNTTWPTKPAGILDGVNHDPPNKDQLQLNAQIVGTPFKFAWVANSGEGTVSKIDTTTGHEVARYYTGPPANNSYAYLSPSRTAVDLEGNCWVGNRAYSFGSVKASVTQILAKPGCVPTSIDNGDGIISGSNELLAWGTDCAVVRHYQVQSPTAPPPGDNVGVRALAIDRDGFLWVGHWREGRCVKLDPTLTGFSPLLGIFQAPNTGPMPLEECSVDTFTFNSYGTRPYGLALSPNGLLYVSGRGARTVLEIDPVGCSICQAQQVPSNANPYGIAVDGDCIVWMADHMGALGRYIRWNPSPPPGTFLLNTGSPGCNSGGRGITVHPDGTIWMACDAANQVAQFDALGVFVDTHNTRLSTATCPSPPPGSACFPVGIGVDIDGHVIAVGQTSKSWAKLDGTTGAIIITGGPQGTGLAPYSYSDLTGNLAALTTQQGFWTVIYDSTNPSQPWGKVSWHSQESPPDSTVSVEVRASDALTGFDSSLAYTKVSNEVPFGTCAIHPVVGQYLEITTTFRRTRPVPSVHCPGSFEEPCAAPFPASPVLRDLTVRGLCCTCALLCNPIVVPCDDATGATVFFGLPPALGDCDSQTGVTCNLSSPQFFGIGSHPNAITCDTLDANGNLVSCAIDVTVTSGCTERGSCCVGAGDGVCLADVTVEYCAAQGGLYLGDQSECSSDICSPCFAPPLGTCQDSCHLQAHAPCCGDAGGAGVTLTICNRSATPQSYVWSMPGPETSEECDAGSTVGPSGTATVAAGACAAIPVSIACPSAPPPPGGAICTGAVVVNASASTLFGCEGELVNSGAYCFDVTPGLVEAPGCTPVTVTIEVTNLDDDSESLDYELAVVPSLGGVDPAPVSLDGLPAGTPVSGSISVPIGMTLPIEVDVEMLAFDPFALYDLVVSYDVDGDGSKEAVSSVALRSVLPCPPQSGACCNHDAGPLASEGLCEETVMNDCVCPRCVWTKGVTCDQITTCTADFIPIPTVSEWGMVVLTLLLLIGGKVYFARREKATA